MLARTQGIVIENKEGLVSALETCKSNYIEVYIIAPDRGFNSQIFSRTENELNVIEQYVNKVVETNKVDYNLELEIHETNEVQEPMVDFMDFISPVIYSTIIKVNQV